MDERGPGMQPNVSVIIPVYNSSKYLDRCLKSLLNQDDINAEFICIDDGSTDNSLKKCQEYASKDGRFKVIKARHRGVSATRNIGLDVASGKYVCFLDSDDRFKHGALKFLYEKAEETQCDTIKFNARIVHGERWMRDSFEKHDELLENFRPNDVFAYKDSRPFVWVHFICRESIKDLRFDESIEIGEDQEFIIRYMIRCKRVLYCSNKLYVHYNLKTSYFNSNVKNKSKMCDEHIKMVKKVLSCVILDSPEFAEWMFDTLFAYCFANINRNQLEDVKDILITYNVEKSLISNHKKIMVS